MYAAAPTVGLAWAGLTSRFPLELFRPSRHYSPTNPCRQIALRHTVDDMPTESDSLMDDRLTGRTATAQAAAPLGADEFQALLVEVLPSAFGYALRLTRNRADAEDLVQDAALRAFRASATFEAGTNFKAWIFRILTRCFWANHRRRQRRRLAA